MTLPQDPIPAPLWRQLRAFAASGQPGQVTLHFGTRQRVEKMTVTFTLAGAAGDEDPAPRHPVGPLAAVLGALEEGHHAES